MIMPIAVSFSRMGPAEEIVGEQCINEDGRGERRGVTSAPSQPWSARLSLTNAFQLGYAQLIENAARFDPMASLR